MHLLMLLAVAVLCPPLALQLLEEFEKNYPGIEFPDLPPRGSFNIKEVLKSTYFFN